MHPLQEIAAMAGVGFEPVMLDADQFGTVRGMEVGLRAGVRRR